MSGAAGRQRQDAALSTLLAQGRRAILAVVIVEGLLIAGLAAFVVILFLQAQAARPCTFFADLGNSPLPPQASALGVTIIEDSRAQFTRDSCPGRLDPPGAELKRLAAKYRIPLRF